MQEPGLHCSRCAQGPGEERESALHLDDLASWDSHFLPFPTCGPVDPGAAGTPDGRGGRLPLHRARAEVRVDPAPVQ